MDRVECIFADPPDNIGLDYADGDDNLDSAAYNLLLNWFVWCLRKANSVWFSFNSRHIATMGHIVRKEFIPWTYVGYRFRPCVQTFGFGAHNPNGLTNCHRHLWLFLSPEAKFHPQNAMVPSVRGKMGDKRAANGGMKTPGDVFAMCRVQGNNRQRRPWHPTQLNEEVVEQCLKLTTDEGDQVLDPFAGTGTTGRVCQRLNRPCTLIEKSPTYFAHLSEEFSS